MTYTVCTKWARESFKEGEKLCLKRDMDLSASSRTICVDTADEQKCLTSSYASFFFNSIDLYQDQNKQSSRAFMDAVAHTHDTDIARCDIILYTYNKGIYEKVSQINQTGSPFPNPWPCPWTHNVYPADTLSRQQRSGCMWGCTLADISYKHPPTREMARK